MIEKKVFSPVIFALLAGFLATSSYAACSEKLSEMMKSENWSQQNIEAVCAQEGAEGFDGTWKVTFLGTSYPAGLQREIWRISTEQGLNIIQVSPAGDAQDEKMAIGDYQLQGDSYVFEGGFPTNGSLVSRSQYAMKLVGPGYIEGVSQSLERGMNGDEKVILASKLQ